MTLNTLPRRLGEEFLLISELLHEVKIVELANQKEEVATLYLSTMARFTPVQKQRIVSLSLHIPLIQIYELIKEFPDGTMLCHLCSLKRYQESYIKEVYNLEEEFVGKKFQEGNSMPIQISVDVHRRHMEGNIALSSRRRRLRLQKIVQKRERDMKRAGRSKKRDSTARTHMLALRTKRGDEELVMRFEGQRVDLITTCPGCFEEVSRYLAQRIKCEDIHNLLGKEKLEALQKEHSLEGERAQNLQLFYRITSIRTILGEISESLREAVKREKREEHLNGVVEEQKREEIRLADIEEETENMIFEAMKDDQRWKEFEVSKDQGRQDLSRKFMSLQRDVEYGTVEFRPSSPRLREHSQERIRFTPRDLLDNGVPKTVEGASVVFGTGSFSVRDHREEVQMAKVEAIRIEKEVEELKVVRENRSKMIERDESIALKEEIINIEGDLMKKRMKEENKRERRRELNLDARRKEKEKKLALRSLLRERTECALMTKEELRMRERVRFEAELCERDKNRRGLMRAEEEQRKVDNFWGLITKERREREIKEKMEKEYQARVEKAMNLMAAVRNSLG